MSQVAVVYWGGTGNTEAMANAVMDGIQKAGAAGSLFTAAEFDAAVRRNCLRLPFQGRRAAGRLGV